MDLPENTLCMGSLRRIPRIRGMGPFLVPGEIPPLGDPPEGTGSGILFPPPNTGRPSQKPGRIPSLPKRGFLLTKPFR